MKRRIKSKQHKLMARFKNESEYQLIRNAAHFMQTTTEKFLRIAAIKEAMEVEQLAKEYLEKLAVTHEETISETVHEPLEPLESGELQEVPSGE